MPDMIVKTDAVADVIALVVRQASTTHNADHRIEQLTPSEARSAVPSLDAKTIASSGWASPPATRAAPTVRSL